MQEVPLTPFAWVSLCFTSLSIFMTLYIWIKVLKWNKQLLRYDSHYRMRFVLVVSLLCSRFTQWLHLVLHVDNVVRYGEYTPLLSVVKSIRFLSVCFLYATLFTILLLTLDRYQRIKMILPGTPRYCFLLLVQLIICAAIVLVLIRTALELGSMNLKHMPLFKLIKENAILFEGCILMIGMVFHYWFTLALMYECVSPFRKPGLPLWLISLRWTRKSKVVLSMTAYFIRLFSTDVAIMVMSLVTSLTDRTLSLSSKMIYFTSFGYSWLPVHVFCLFKLLDMLVKRLRQAKERRPDKSRVQLPLSMANPVPHTTSASVDIPYISSHIQIEQPVEIVLNTHVSKTFEESTNEN